MTTSATLTPPTTTPAPPSKKGAWRGPALAVALGALVGYGGFQVGGSLGHAMKTSAARGLQLTTMQNAALVTSCALALVLVLLAHELGHLLAGRLVGFRAFLLVVGPMRLERGADRWYLHLNKNLGLAGGLAGSAPTDARNLRQRSAVMFAGGPVTSLLTGGAALAAAWALDPLHLAAGASFLHVWGIFVATTYGITSLFIGIVTLAPLKTSGFLSDGARLLQALRGGAVAERDAAIQAVTGASLSGQRPRDWSPALLEAMQQPADGSVFEHTAWQLAAAHAADRGQHAEARRWMDHILLHIDRLPATLHAGLRLEAVRQFAMEGDVARAREQLALASGPAIGAQYMRPLALAALALAEGRNAEARPLLSTVRQELASGIDRGSMAWITELVQSLEQRAAA